MDRFRAVDGIDGVLLDIDGVLTVSWEPLPGASETLAWLRAKDLPFRLITNTTSYTRVVLAEKLSSVDLVVSPDEVVTAVVATGVHLHEVHQGASVFLVSSGDARADLEGVRLVGRDEDADVVVIGGAGDVFDYANVNHAFRLLMDGAAFVAMHRTPYWRTTEGWQLDGGAYVAALEEATGARATVCGKPAATYFGAALSQLGIAPDRAVMVGDDVVNDVLGAQAAGIRGVLVRTGKFRPEDLAAAPGEPDATLPSIEGLVDLLGRS